MRYGYDKIGRILSASQHSLQERFAFDPAHNIVPVAQEGQDKSASQGALKNNRLEVFEDKRYAYDTHGNLIEKRIGKHTVIKLSWDVEHQLQSATVTKAAHTDKSVSTETKYRYDAFGRRLEKRDRFAATLFEWDGNRLLSERRGSKHTLYVYEADSFAPLAQVELNGASSKETPTKTQDTPGPAAIKLELDEEDWQPRKTAQAFREQMRAFQLETLGKVKGQQEKEQEPRDFEETLPPPEDEPQAENGKVVSLKDWRVRYYHNDHLGTPRELSDEDGSIVWQASYRAWGNTLKVVTADPQALQNQEQQTRQRLTAQNDPNLQAQPIEQNLRFQGQYYDQETGLHYNRFRYYDPDVGRFVGQDPIKLMGGANLYQYMANPLSWIDPLGLKCTKAIRDSMKKAGMLLEGHAAHHVIPESVWNSLGQACKDKLNLNLNGAYNAIALPCNQQSKRERGRNIRTPIHDSNHRGYNEAVKSKLTAICRDFNGKDARTEMFKYINELKNNLTDGNNPFINGNGKLR